MSKMDMSTQDIFLRLGGTSQSRSAKADAVFRRLRFDQAAQISDALARAPKWIDVEEEDAAVIAASNKD